MKNKFYFKKGVFILFTLCFLAIPKLRSTGQAELTTKTVATVFHDDTIAPANSKPLIKVLDDLKTRYQVSFNYNSDQLEGKRVNKNLLTNKKNLEQTLKSVLTPLGLKFEKLHNNFYLIYTEKSSSHLLPTERTNLKNFMVVSLNITGKLIIAFGNAWPGVSISAKGTSTGTSTGASGLFTASRFSSPWAASLKQV